VPNQPEKIMAVITSTNQMKFDSGVCVDLNQSDQVIGVRALIGTFNYFRVGVFDAVRLVQDALNAAGMSNWRASAAMDRHVPDGAVIVGSVTVHHGDQPFSLYVRVA
jgi:hypothetical protein